MDENKDYSLMLEFDNNKPEFAYGFECGRIWALLHTFPESEITEIMHPENSEMILRMAEATKRQVIATPISENHAEIVFSPSED